MVSKEKKNAIVLRKLLNTGAKHFVLTPYVTENYSRLYKYVQYSKKAYNEAVGNVGTISDGFILYVISILGVCDLESIRSCLINLSKHNLSLNIADMTDKDSLRKRLRELFKMGYVFKITYAPYQNADVNENNEDSEDNEHISSTNLVVVLYTLTQDAHTIMNHILSKRVESRDFLYFQREQEIIGNAASSYITSCLIQSPNFKTLKDGSFYTKELGKAFIDSEIVLSADNDDYYVGMVHSYIHKDERIMSDDDYLECCINKLNLIRNYLYVRNRKGKSRVICVCESNEDLVSFCNLIMKTNAFGEHLNHVYFMGEGAVRGNEGDISKCFLQMTFDENSDTGYTFIQCTPSFM